MSDESEPNEETPQEPGDELSSDEAMRWAAEEPTAMWDSSALETEGFDQLIEDRKARPREATGPATTQGVGGSAALAATSVTRSEAGVSKPAARRRSGGLSWVLTFAVAIGLGLLVYFLASALR